MPEAYTTKDEALQAAKTAERETTQPHYVTACERRAGFVMMRAWEVSPRMPYLGEWYDADGIRHG